MLLRICAIYHSCCGMKVCRRNVILAGGSRGMPRMLHLFWYAYRVRAPAAAFFAAFAEYLPHPGLGRIGGV
jgi:hypothetical protein